MKQRDLESDRTAAEIGRAQAVWILPAWLRRAMQMQPRQLLDHLGLPGIIAIGLLTACATFYVSVMMPLDRKIDEVQETVRTLSERVDQVAKGSRQNALPVAQQLTEFYRIFPKQSQLTDAVGRIFEIAAMQGITLQQGEYRVAEDQAGELRRFQLIFPVKAEYLQIRRFLASLAADLPTTVLEHIQFERQKIGDPLVAATIKLALYVDQGS